MQKIVVSIHDGKQHDGMKLPIIVIAGAGSNKPLSSDILAAHSSSAMREVSRLFDFVANLIPRFFSLWHLEQNEKLTLLISFQTPPGPRETEDKETKQREKCRNQNLPDVPIPKRKRPNKADITLGITFTVDVL